MFVGSQNDVAPRVLETEIDWENPDADWTGGMYEPNLTSGANARPPKNAPNAMTMIPTPMSVLFMLENDPICIV